MRHFQQFCENSLDLIQCIATDLDGTLTHAGRFTPALLKALEALTNRDLTVVIVTGRSAGWVSGLVSYLPIAGAIAENGGLYFPGKAAEPIWVSGAGKFGNLEEVTAHRQQLAAQFRALQAEFPQIQESTDNRFRLTDWTFDVQGLSQSELATMGDRCQEAGWGFTYSTVQCHIRPQGQDKAIALEWVLHHSFPHLNREQVLTIGDSPNDASLFDPAHFPHSVGVANVRHYLDQLPHPPAYVTTGSEVDGFCEIVTRLINARSRQGF